MRVKICGITSPQDAALAVHAGADAIGMLFAPSPRKIDRDAAEQIISAAEEDGADMIVVGGRHRSFLKASVLGATTERVVRHAHCPVLTVVAE